jgi:hypothetical protein
VVVVLQINHNYRILMITPMYLYQTQAVGHRLEEESMASNQSGKPDHMDKLVKIWDRVFYLAKGDGVEHCSNRIKFMLLDLIELRDNGWVARRKTETAKTLQEIHMEAAKEMPRRSNSSASLRRGTSGDIRMAAASIDKDGFTIVPTNPKIARSMSQGTMRRSHSGGNMGGAPLPAFRRSTSDAAGGGGSTSPYQRSPGRIKSYANKDSTSEDSKKGFSGLQDSLPFDTIAETKTVDPKVSESKVPTLDLAQCEKKVKSVVKEYLTNHDENDAHLSVKEIVQTDQPESDERGAKCVEAILFFMTESTKPNVEQFMALWKKLTTSPKDGQQAVLNEAMILKGIRTPLEILRDILIDAPLAKAILIDLLAGVMSWKALPSNNVSFMTNLPQEFISDGKAAEFAVKLLRKLESMEDGKHKGVLTLEENVKAIETLMTSEEKEKSESTTKFIEAVP